MVCPDFNEFHSDQLYSFRDDVDPCQKLKGIRLHLDDSSSKKVIGIQSIYDADREGFIHLHPSAEGVGGEIIVYTNSNVRLMKVAMEKHGLTNVAFISAKSGAEKGDSSDLYLDITEGYYIAGIHGIATDKGIVGLGLIFQHGTEEFEIPQKSDIEAYAEVFAKASDVATLTGVLTTAKKYLDNASKEPFTSKFRSVRLGNKVFGRIVASPGGLDLLSSIGFAVYTNSEDFFVSIPLGLDLTRALKMVSDTLAQ